MGPIRIIPIIADYSADSFRYDPVYDYYNFDIEECPFLNKNTMCAVHDVRTAICRLYPFSCSSPGDAG